MSSKRWFGILLKAFVLTLLFGAVGLGFLMMSEIPVYKGPDPQVQGVRKRWIKVNGVKLHIAEAGAAEKPLVLFLHGFPEFWYEWRNYLPHFAAKGYYAVAPDQRGYNLSDKPSEVSAYRIKHLVADVEALIKALGKKKAILVGHDWGAFVTWSTAMTKPEIVTKAVTINVPHPLVFSDALKHNAKQRRRSTYIALFRLPLLPEKLLARNNWARLSGALTKTSLPGTYSAAELKHYRHAWSRPGAFTSMLNWYRAAPKTMTPQRRKALSRKIKPPMLLLWGAKDQALGVEMAKPSIAYCKNGRLKLYKDATHWIVHEKTKELQREILKFLKTP